MSRVGVIIGSLGEASRLADSPPVVPRSDRAALGLALQRFSAPVEAYCLRDDDQAWRYALAAGAVTARRVYDVTSIDFDVLLVGSGGAEPWGDALLAQLAEQKQCAMVFDVLDVVPSAAGLTVTRHLGRGSRERLALSGPAVLGIADEAPQLLYVSYYRRQTVHAPPPEPGPVPGHDALSRLSSAWQPVRARVKTGDLAAKTRGSATERLQTLVGGRTVAAQEHDRSHVIVADAATCARHLLRFLRHHGIIGASASSPTTQVQITESGSPDQPPSLPRDTRAAAATVWPPHLRGPRPLDGASHGRDRRPRLVCTMMQRQGEQHHD